MVQDAAIVAVRIFVRGERKLVRGDAIIAFGSNGQKIRDFVIIAIRSDGHEVVLIAEVYPHNHLKSRLIWS